MNDNLKYNRVQAINVDTGEILGTTYLKTNGNEEVVLKTCNPKQEEAIKEKNKEIESIMKFIEENEGGFIHLLYRYSYPIMTELQNKCSGTNANIHMTRFIVLSTYLTWGNKLFDENRNRIKKSSLSKIWDVKNRNSINQTYNLLKECDYIYETEEGYIMLNQEMVIKGSVKDNFEELRKEYNDLTYTRVFTKNIQDIYRNTDQKQRKLLGNLFKILPFINFKYNVFCTNPTETDEDKIIPMTWTDLARICGYEEKNHVTRFKKDLFKLTIYGYEVIGQFTTKSGYEIVVNPKVYYAGNNVDDVDILYAMFKMSNNRNKL